MQFQNLLASGCSYTADGIGGVPPTLDSPGSSRFKDDIDYPAAPCRVWVSFLSQWLEVTSFANFASASHGMVLTKRTIVDALKKYNYTPDNTLVAFNITSFDRLDVFCDWQSEYKSPRVPWDQTYFDYTVVKNHSLPWKEEFKKLSLDEINQRSLDALSELFEYLETNKYQYFFTMLHDYTSLPIVQEHSDHMITLGLHNGMYEYAKAGVNLMESDNFHITPEAQEQIAKYALHVIKNAR
jgi:hypothetical protein